MSTRFRVSLENHKEEIKVTITRTNDCHNLCIDTITFAELYLLHLRSHVVAENRKSLKAVPMENVLNGQIGVNGPNVHKHVEEE